MSKQHSKQGVFKRRGKSEEPEDQNIIQQILGLMEQLYEVRLIERISRPDDRKIKEELIKKFSVKFDQLHDRLEKVRSEVVEIGLSENGNTKNRSVMGSVTNRPGEWRKCIHGIESRYVEVFVEGSFKYFKKVCVALGFAYDGKIEPINIQEWANACLQGKQGDACC